MQLNNQNEQNAGGLSDGWSQGSALFSNGSFSTDEGPIPMDISEDDSFIDSTPTTSFNNSPGSYQSTQSTQSTVDVMQDSSPFTPVRQNNRKMVKARRQIKFAAANGSGGFQDFGNSFQGNTGFDDFENTGFGDFGSSFGSGFGSKPDNSVKKYISLNDC